MLCMRKRSGLGATTPRFAREAAAAATPSENFCATRPTSVGPALARKSEVSVMAGSNTGLSSGTQRHIHNRSVASKERGQKRTCFKVKVGREQCCPTLKPSLWDKTVVCESSGEDTPCCEIPPILFLHNLKRAALANVWPQNSAKPWCQVQADRTITDSSRRTSTAPGERKTVCVFFFRLAR